MPVQKGFPVAEDTDVVEVMEDTVVEVVEIEDVATHDQIILDLSVEMNDVPKSEVCSEPEAMTDFPKSEFPSELHNTLSELPRCKRCLTPTDPTVPGCRMSGKVAVVKIVCKKCVNRDTALRRLCGRWPLQEFDELTEQEQVDFYQRCGTTMAHVRNHVSETLVRVRMRRKNSLRSGQFLPLSVYEKMGYNTADIEGKTEPGDIADHPVLGTTYRVELHGMSRALLEEEVRQEVFSNLASKRRRAPFGSDGAAGASSGDKNAAPADGASDIDTSGSSSDSDDKNKKKKAKRNRTLVNRWQLRDSRAKKAEQPQGEPPLPPGTTSREQRLISRAQQIARQREEREAEKAVAKREREAAKAEKKKATKERQDNRKAEKAKARLAKRTRKIIVDVCTKTIVAARPVIRTAETLLADPGAQKAPRS